MTTRELIDAINAWSESQNTPVRTTEHVVRDAQCAIVGVGGLAQVALGLDLATAGVAGLLVGMLEKLDARGPIQ